MTRRTETSWGRRNDVQMINGRVVAVIKKDTPLPADQRMSTTFEYNGVELTVMTSPGQVINKQRAYNREMKRRGVEVYGKRH